VSTLEKDFKNYNLTEEISPFLLEYYNKKNKTVPSLLKPNVKHFDPDFIDFEIQKLKKQVVYKDNDEMDTVRDMFDILGVPWVIADGEAETLCSHLCLRGEVDAVLSEDSDVMAYQTPLFISKINIYRDTVIEVDFKKILEGLEISKEQFVDLCIMCGTDYNKNIPKVGPKTALNLIKEYGSIEGINENTTYSISILNHEKVRELFIARGDEEITIPYCTPCDFAKVSEFFFKNNISINMSIIEKAFSQRVLDFFSDGEDEE
jgi:5'-3' exonuclease